MMQTVDTDVVVIAISVAEKINVIEKYFGFLAIHEIAQRLGPSKYHRLILLHAFTECEEISAFANTGKNTTLNGTSKYTLFDLE